MNPGPPEHEDSWPPGSDVRYLNDDYDDTNETDHVITTEQKAANIGTVTIRCQVTGCYWVSVANCVALRNTARHHTTRTGRFPQVKKGVA